VFSPASLSSICCSLALALIINSNEAGQSNRCGMQSRDRDKIEPLRSFGGKQTDFPYIVLMNSISFVRVRH
jgi:hypothetical protein